MTAFFDSHPTPNEIVRDMGASNSWWYACQHPERPHDEYAIYSVDCRACRYAFEAVRRTRPETPIHDVEPSKPIRVVTAGTSMMPGSR